MVGKWHLGSAAAFQPRNRGFDRFFGFLGGGHDYYTSDATSRRTDDSPLTDDDDEVGFEGYLTDVLTDKAIEWVQESRTNPYFLLLAYNAPHGPWQAPAALRQKYSTVASGDRQTYLAMVDSLDTNIGRLVAAVAAGGNRDNTLIFFVSDHGGANSVADHGPFNTGKGSMSEGGSHVPFLACWPGRWAAGTTYAPMVSAMDIGATALAMASVAPGADDASLDGVNLDPFVRGEDDAAPHEALFWRKTLSDKAWAVLRGDMRLGGTLQPAPAAWLFNVRTDPGEETNLFAEQRETAQELVDLWNAWNADNESGTTSNGIGVYWSKLEEFQDEYADQLETDADAAGFTIETF